MDCACLCIDSLQPSDVHWNPSAARMTVQSCPYAMSCQTQGDDAPTNPFGILRAGLGQPEPEGTDQ